MAILSRLWCWLFSCCALVVKMAFVRDVQHFVSLTITELTKFLREREVPVVGGEKHKELAEKAFWAEKLGLKVKVTDEQAEHEIQQSKSRKLKFDGGIIQLPRPETLTSGWECGPASLPETSRDDLDSYIKAGNRRIGLEKTEGKRTLALGKGLLLSGHVRGLEYHGISSNLSYCFVRGKVIPQQKTTETPYNTWVVLNKELGKVCTGECSCIIGIQSTCKHICALLFAVIEAVEAGRNATSTSQKQVWGKPPKRGENIHQPQFVKNIKIINIKEDVTEQLQNNRKMYRSDFDPRIQAHRKKKELESFDLDTLASITNGNCGLFVHVNRQPDPKYERPDFSLPIDEEAVSTTILAPTVQEVIKTFDKVEDISASEIITRLAINAHQQEVLVKATTQQAASQLWLDHRKGRITASVAGDVANSVKDGKVTGHSQIARVMGYYEQPNSAAISWGKKNENIARKQYIAHHKRRKHIGVKCTETGLMVSLERPYIAASPDGLISCKQCGDGLLELKNPYSTRNLTIDQLANAKGSCLTKVNGITILKRQHAYYAQVQIQMWASGHTWCDFAVRTVSKTNNFFVERINVDLLYINSILSDIEVFFKEGIVPELKTRRVEKIVREAAVHKTMLTMLEKLEYIPNRNTVEYPCGICGEECQQNVVDVSESSIACDNCDRWCHYSCEGLTGSETFLKKRKFHWTCSGCKPRKRLRKVTVKK